MGRVNTRRIVACTVTHENRIGDWPVLDLIGHTVRRRALAVDSEDAVALAGSLTGPEPAITRLIDAGPESGDVLWGILRMHREPPTLGVMERDVCSIAALSPHCSTVDCFWVSDCPALETSLPTAVKAAPARFSSALTLPPMLLRPSTAFSSHELIASE